MRKVFDFIVALLLAIGVVFLAKDGALNTIQFTILCLTFLLLESFILYEMNEPKLEEKHLVKALAFVLSDYDSEQDELIDLFSEEQYDK